MNLLNTYYRIFIISSIIICFSFLNSCYKPDQTIAVIRVWITIQIIQLKTLVSVYFLTIQMVLMFHYMMLLKNTWSNGTARFDFSDEYKDGQGGFAVLDIEVDGGIRGCYKYCRNDHY